MATLTELGRAIHQTAVEKGWWDQGVEGRNIGEALALVHSEVSEALEEWRNGHAPAQVYYQPEHPDKPEGFGVELADAVIRIMDLAEAHNIDLEGLIVLKARYNATREHRHGNKLA